MVRSQPHVLSQLTAEYNNRKASSRYTINTGTSPFTVTCSLRYENRGLVGQDQWKLLYETPGEELAPEYYPEYVIEEFGQLHDGFSEFESLLSKV